MLCYLFKCYIFLTIPQGEEKSILMKWKSKGKFFHPFRYFYPCLGSGSATFWIPGSGSATFWIPGSGSAKMSGSRGKISTKTKNVVLQTQNKMVNE